MTVGSSGTLMGNNITALGGTTTVNGTLSVGNNGVGAGSFASLTLAGTDVMEVNARGSAGIAYDTINVSTALTYGGELQLVFGGAITSDPAPLALFTGVTGSGNLGSVTIYGSGGYKTTLLDNSGVWSGTADLAYGGGAQQFTFTQATGNLLVTAVPEPATWALLAFSLTTVMVLRRRRA